MSSDNGPWLSYNDHGGSAGLLKNGKGTTWEGGMREPTIAWNPGRIKAGVYRADKPITVFKSVGNAAQDLACAAEVLRLAETAGSGGQIVQF